MKPLPPRVVGPISPCNSAVRVQGQVAGASVQIFQTGNVMPIGQGVAVSGDQIFSLNGSPIKPGLPVFARQTASGGQSDVPPSNEQTIPLAQATLYGPLGQASYLADCGQCVQIVGAYPGASVTLRSASALRSAPVAAVDGTVTVRMLSPLQYGEQL